MEMPICSPASSPESTTLSTQPEQAKALTGLVAETAKSQLFCSIQMFPAHAVYVIRSLS